MRDLVLAAKELQTLCENNGWKHCIIGGLALQVWGENRLTIDVDLTVLSDIGTEEAFVAKLLAAYRPRIADAREFALKRRVLLIETADGIEIDVSLGLFDFERSMISRAELHEFLPGVELRICSAEDLIVSKSFAARLKDWMDVESILIRQQLLDWRYIFRWLEPLVELKEAPEILIKLNALRKANNH